ncbi:MAG TPA: FtsX-like permease family protein [Rhodocyclaceae bacterium]|nr:FtsX-like permease family protein [Rhodocyclaceae bacterium]
MPIRPPQLQRLPHAAPMIHLAWWLVCAQFKTRRTASALSMLAIALGVALAYAIHLINAAALQDFSQAMKSVQGEPDAVIAPRDSAGRVPLDLINALARDPAVAVVAPVIETRVRIDDEATPVKLIGIDVFSAALVMPALLPETRPAANAAAAGNLFAGAVYASPALLSRLQLQPGDRLELRRGEARWSARIAGALPAARPGEPLLVADIAWVQAHFGPPDGVGEGRLRLAPNVDVGSWLAAWQDQLPAGLVLRAAADDTTRVSNISRAYRVNLNVLALVALLTGAFLVFATQLTAVAQRSTQFALLGVLGLSPRMRLLQVLLEGLAIGAPGAALGLALGYGMAFGFTRMIGGDLGGGYFSGSTPVIATPLLPTLGFFALGCAASLAGALYPAWLNRVQPLAQALKTGFAQQPPVARGAESRGAGSRGAGSRGTGSRGTGSHGIDSRSTDSRGADAWRSATPLQKIGAIATRRSTVIGLLALAAVGLTRLPPLFELPLAGYAAVALVLVLGITAAPLLTQTVFGTVARWPLPAAQRIAVQNIVQAPLMAQVAASGLIVSFALTVSMVTMVASFRLAVDQWLDVVLPAPLYVRSKGVPLPQDLLTALAQADAPFARVQRAANSALSLDPQRPAVALLVRDVDRTHPGERLPFTGPVVNVPADQVAVWISEAAQEIYQLRVGQTLKLPLLGREVEAVIGGVWRDYSRQFGAVVIGSADYRALGGRFEATELALWPRPGQEAAAKDWLAAQTRKHQLEMAELGELRKLSLAIFDQSFAVTYALEAAAMLIGLFGLAVTLAASVWLRARELATLSALGFNRAMLTRAVMLEGALIAGIGLVIGLACGIAIGAILTHVVNPQAFHWRMELRIPWQQVLPGAALTLLAGIAASRFAARLATRLPAAQVLANAQ